ncbi:hypothetical protein EYF80_004215 [Liparis tanakae]|uniref:Uncharacterized protein n=1 Tax=Liparis tanakae TaxID=230148 RepID=A0A4Z2J814_9TELE|nr:hypothetical protein EYF80_004215 [Liparis tanakae]
MLSSKGRTSCEEILARRLRFRYSLSCSSSEPKNSPAPPPWAALPGLSPAGPSPPGRWCPSPNAGTATDKLTLRMRALTSVSSWMLKMTTSSGAADRTRATPSRNWASSRDRKCSWEVLASLSVMLLDSISSVMMVTWRRHCAETEWTPSEETRERTNRTDGQRAEPAPPLETSLCSTERSVGAAFCCRLHGEENYSSLIVVFIN